MALIQHITPQQITIAALIMMFINSGVLIGAARVIWTASRKFAKVDELDAAVFGNGHAGIKAELVALKAVCRQRHGGAEND